METIFGVFDGEISSGKIGWNWMVYNASSKMRTFAVKGLEPQSFLTLPPGQVWPVKYDALNIYGFKKIAFRLLVQLVMV